MRGVLIDLDGVIWESDAVIEGAPATVGWLEARQIPYLFVTNTTSRPRELIAEKLATLGIDTDTDRILTPPVAAAHWISKYCKQPCVLIVPDATLADFADVASTDVNDTQPVAAVVIGDIGDGWSYALMNRVFRQLMRSPPPQLVALGMTRYWRADDGLRLDVAPFIKAFEHASGCQPVVLGKPSRDFYAIALQMINCDPLHTVMIGDDIQGDVLGAQECGMQGLLVKTGKFRPADMDTGVMPDALLDSIADLPDWWEQQERRYAVN